MEDHEPDHGRLLWKYNFPDALWQFKSVIFLSKNRKRRARYIPKTINYPEGLLFDLLDEGRAAIRAGARSSQIVADGQAYSLMLEEHPQ